MRVYDLIWKKREGKRLTREELHFLISGFVRGTIPDYQMSAWLMAVYFQGMSFDEVTDLTLEMLHSGTIIDLTSIPGIKVDKHSTGGVGDKTSLVLLPLVAAAGVPVAKMSGRGLGHTGGTIDKLEAIPGFNTGLTKEEFLRQVREIGIVITSQTRDLVPADKKLYALRDLTATVESIPLIAGSIVSKKLASGADAVLLDVKYGAGAFMGDYEVARKLAETMVEIGNRAGRRFKAVLTDMNQPLGQAIGNSLEVAEAIRTLQGKGPADLTELSLTMAGLMLWLGQRAGTPETGKQIAAELLHNGAALTKLKELIRAQGGNPAVADEPGLLPAAPVVRQVTARVSGWIAAIDCRELGLIAMELGAGRLRLDDVINPEVGLKLLVKIGTQLVPGTPVAEVHARNEADAARAQEKLLNCLKLSDSPPTLPTLIREII
ncbi:MAG TPA: thymidine phosphorylase [Bacillota bacterium]